MVSEKMMKGKKGLTREFLIKMIIVLLVAGVLLIALPEYLSVHQEIFTSETCRTSVSLRAGILEKGGLLSAIKNLPPLKCKTEYECITLGGQCEQGYSEINVGNDKEIKKEIADVMYKCWDMLGKGDRQFLRHSSETQCVMCTVIQFDNRIQNKYEKIAELNKYLLETPVPGKNFTYTEFFGGEPNENVEETEIGTNENLAVLYLAADSRSTLKKWTDDIAGLASWNYIPKLYDWVFKVGNEQASSLTLVQYKAGEITKVCRDMKNVV